LTRPKERTLQRENDLMAIVGKFEDFQGSELTLTALERNGAAVT
jgi:hypothetical protein